MDSEFKHYSKEELATIKSIELLILEKIHKFCLDNNIKYFLAGGTALGAVRHRGFIPWDDDIDLGMLREDYETFISKSNDFFAENNMFLENYYTEKTCPYLYSKVRMNGTMFVEYANRNVKMHFGVYVDIFPFDNMPNDERLAKKQFSQFKKIERKWCLAQSSDVSQKPISFTDNLKSLIRKVAHFFLKFASKKRIYCKAIRLSTKYNSTDTAYVQALFTPRYKEAIMSKKSINEVHLVPFENMQVYCINNVDSYLKQQYGDYMQLPPEDKRHAHRPFYVDVSAFEHLSNPNFKSGDKQ